MHHSISQMKTPTWCNTVQVLYLQGHSTCFGRKRPSSGVLWVSHHISLLGPPALIRRCDDWPATITHVPVAAVLVLNTPDDRRLRPKHVEWPCRNKICTVLHQVGVSFDLYYDARKHKIKTTIYVVLREQFCRRAVSRLNESCGDVC